MRDLIALLYRTLRTLINRTPRHRAPGFPGAHLPPVGAPTTMLLPRHVQERRGYLAGEEVALVRPYLLAHEHRMHRDVHREQFLQRERRTAAALASMGIDYDITAVAI